MKIKNPENTDEYNVIRLCHILFNCKRVEKKAAAPKAAKKVMTEAEKKAEEEIKKAASKIAALATPKKK